MSIVVVGGGPAGLAVAGALKQKGRAAVVLERGDAVGWRWRQHYDRLCLHTAQRMSHLPGLPYPPGTPTYVPRDHFVQYLESYVRHFQLDVRTGIDVQHIEKQDGLWKLAGLEARHLVIATGFCGEPKRPTWPGLETFRGPLLHSSEYRNHQPFAGQRVLVVGLGNSGAEIALDLTTAASAVYISIRKAFHVLPRDTLGIPGQYTSVALQYVPRQLSDTLAGVASLLHFGRLDDVGLRRPNRGVFTHFAATGQVPIIDIGLIRALRAGRAQIVAEVKHFDAAAAHLTDGQVVPLDAVVLATGYRSQPILNIERPRLYEPELGAWFIGFQNPLTGQLRDIHREAVEVARRITKLP